MKTICFFNLKGGVGKTMTTANVAYLLGRYHKKNILCIDADSQGNLSQYFGVTPEKGTTTVDLLTGVFDPYATPIPLTKFPSVDIIPADSALMDYDVTALTTGKASSQAIDELRFAILESELEHTIYDYILIDCPPAFTAAASAALIAADEVVIPIRLDAFSTAGMAELMAQIRNMHRINPRINLRGILVTQFLKTPEEGAALQWLQEKSGLPVFGQVIRHSNRVGGSTFAKEPLEIFSRNCGAARDYRLFTADLVGGDEDGL